jgi:molybdopterin molybdotransferase
MEKNNVGYFQGEAMKIKLDKAQQILLAQTKVMNEEDINLTQGWRRVLAQTINAGTDFPPFDRSPLDGYAVIADEVRGATVDCPVTLRVVDNIPAGTVGQVTVIPGTAARIMTGAPIPAGATGVVRLESTQASDGLVSVLDGDRTDKNICLQGEEIAAGEMVLKRGAVINAGTMGMLALLGISLLRVYKRPKVAIIATGSEIVPVEAPLTPGTIRNSNSYMLIAQVEEAGGEPVFMGIVPDDTSRIAESLRAAENCDLIITTGGVSVGDYDLMGQVYQRLGANVLFERVGMKPGMPVMAASKENCLYMGLSGNPAAAAIAFEQLVRPVIRKMAGHTALWRPRIRAVLTAPFTKPSNSVRFVWARCSQRQGRVEIEPLQLQGNGMMKSAMLANALAVIPENSPPLAAGTEVEAIILDTWY